MSKADGQKIAIKFTEPITSDLSISLGYAYTALTGAAVTSSGQYSIYSASRTIDGSFTTQWVPPNPYTSGWIRYQLSAAKRAVAIRLYTSASYYPKDCIVYGSDDGTTLVQLTSFTCVSHAGWQEFQFTNANSYLYYRLQVVNSYQEADLYEVQLGFAVGLESAFSVTGQEYSYVPGGELQASEYAVESVAAHPTEENAILLTIVANDRFESVVGNITVAYDSTKGNLAGAGGPVESFSVTFTPADLVAKPHQNDQENIEIVSVSATGTLSAIIYTSVYEAEHIEISSINVTGTLTHVDDL